MLTPVSSRSSTGGPRQAEVYHIQSAYYTWETPANMPGATLVALAVLPQKAQVKPGVPLSIACISIS